MVVSFIALDVGDVFASDYEVLRPLAQGGMGAVYAVAQRSTGRRRALKVMLPSALADDGLRARFTLEAQIAARIASDHVVEVFAAGVDPTTNVPWLVMELLEGEDLAATLRARERLPPHEVAAVFSQLGHALSRAHAAGVVHRDLKPANIFLASPRAPGLPFMVKVLDFGIAKVLHESMTSGTSTAAVGSPLWMAPEQTESGGRVGPTADVFALGLIAFRMLTGFGFWRSANTPGAAYGAVIREMFVDEIPTASARAAEYGAGAFVPPGFDAWFARCVAKEPEARYPDASQAIPALLSLLESAPVVAEVRPSVALAPTLPSLAAVPAAEPVPRMMALPPPVLQTAVSQSLASPASPVPVGAQGAAPADVPRPPATSPTTRGPGRVLAGAVAFVAIAALVGILASRAASPSSPPEPAKPPSVEFVGPIPAGAAQGVDAGTSILDAGTVAAPTDPHTGRPRAATDAGRAVGPAITDLGPVPPPTVTDVPAPSPVRDAVATAPPPVIDAGATPAPPPPPPPSPSADAGTPAPPPPPPPRDADPCAGRRTCHHCSSRIGCGWCAGMNRCVSDDRRDDVENRGCGAVPDDPTECPSNVDGCAHITDCRACVDAPFCNWCTGRGCFHVSGATHCRTRISSESECR